MKFNYLKNSVFSMRSCALGAILLTLAQSAMISGCGKPKSAAVVQENKENVISITKNHGGPLNFGISFSAVNEQISKDFWTAHENPSGYSKRILGESKKGSGDFMLGESMILGGIKHPKLAQEVESILKVYLSATASWYRLGCVDLDMNQINQGKNVETGTAGITIENEFFPRCEFREEGNSSKKTTEVVLKSKQPFGLPKIPASLDMQAAQSNRDKSKPMFVVGTLLGDPVLAAAFSQSVQLDGKLHHDDLIPRVAMIVGDYVIPTHSWATSKATAVPVMKFDSDPKSPNYLKPIAFYDYGLLYLNRLPEEGIVLTSRVGENLAGIWSKKETRSNAGYLMHVTPNRVNQYIPIEEHKKIGSHDEKMERMPVGSVHFVANTYWIQGSRGLSHLVTVPKISRQKLISLYLGEGKNQGAWINILDRQSFLPRTTTHEEFSSFARKGDCKGVENFDGLTPGVFLETEVILGLEAGRKLMMENQEINTFTCEAFLGE